MHFVSCFVEVLVHQRNREAMKLHKEKGNNPSKEMDMKLNSNLVVGLNLLRTMKFKKEDKRERDFSFIR